MGDVPCEHSPPRLLVIGRASCPVQVLLQAPSSRRHLAQPRQVPLLRRRSALRPLFSGPARPIHRGPGRSLVCTRLVPSLGSERAIQNLGVCAPARHFFLGQIDAPPCTPSPSRTG